MPIATDRGELGERARLVYEGTYCRNCCFRTILFGYFVTPHLVCATSLLGYRGVAAMARSARIAITFLTPTPKEIGGVDAWRQWGKLRCDRCALLLRKPVIPVFNQGDASSW